jgi:macrodomain Ter protein organizer (MatP/YcbG family)
MQVDHQADKGEKHMQAVRSLQYICRARDVRFCMTHHVHVQATSLTCNYMMWASVVVSQGFVWCGG